MKTTANQSYEKLTLWLVVTFALFRAGVAFTQELGNDESYYWVYSQRLQWNYFDHPPLVALWTKIFTLDLLLEDYPGFLRLGSLVSCGLSSFFIYRATALLHSPKAGFYAACLYNASFYSGLTAGLLLMPDAPQMVFWTLCLWMIARLLQEGSEWSSWILLGIGAGLCIMSKVHGAFIWIGLGLYTLFQRRDWLTRPHLYVAAGLTLLICAPILTWNIKNDFVTYRFHSQRVTIEEDSLSLFSFPRELMHQLLWNNPVNVALISFGIRSWWLDKEQRLPALTVYLFIGVPLAAFLLFISFFRDTVLPHWSGPAYVSLIPLAAVALARLHTPPFPKSIRWSLGFFVIGIMSWILFINFYPGTSGNKSESQLGRGDLTLDIYGWKEAGEKFKDLYSGEMEKGLARAGAPLVCSYWWGAHVEYYFARPLGIKMIGLGPMNQLRHYQWVNAWRKESVNADTAYCIIPSDDNYAVPASYYRKTVPVATITVQRSGKPAHSFRVYRLYGLRKKIPVAF